MDSIIFFFRSRFDSAQTLEISRLSATLNCDHDNVDIDAKERNVVIQDGQAVFQFAAAGQFAAGRHVRVTAVVVYLTAASGSLIAIKLTPLATRSIVPAEFLRYR